MSADRLRAIRDAATPGPWKVEDEAPLLVWTSGVDTDGTLIPAAMAVSSRDAALIALAPDLAEWAADAADALEDVGRYLASMSDPSPAAARSEALLARLADLVPS